MALEICRYFDGKACSREGVKECILFRQFKSAVHKLTKDSVEPEKTREDIIYSKERTDSLGGKYGCPHYLPGVLGDATGEIVDEALSQINAVNLKSAQKP
ncbi:MAG: hypothetical protein A2857_04435 [Candidatus Levybacteria bacterium RIFCSPHIGHO2_01_FULL_36_15]|nr:MAG: hypothetical protein A2857_04435 [Candidatus Levybacteria bacterium RIFCSPHIGHO2_01_FULL_36_15]OGH38605.1 MAG: hypothetical protein A2905_03190 [Candidatus Levybacteria bacterium RIFCSPLOWO2_01_FULL_36_10]